MRVFFHVVFILVGDGMNSALHVHEESPRETLSVHTVLIQCTCTIISLIEATLSTQKIAPKPLLFRAVNHRVLRLRH